MASPFQMPWIDMIKPEIEEVVTAYAYDESGKQVSHATMTAVIKPKR